MHKGNELKLIQDNIKAYIEEMGIKVSTDISLSEKDKADYEKMSSDIASRANW